MNSTKKAAAGARPLKTDLRDRGGVSVGLIQTERVRGNCNSIKTGLYNPVIPKPRHAGRRAARGRISLLSEVGWVFVSFMT